MKKKITFIIVTWNNEDTIIDCLDSVYNFCNNFEVIVVDNNSTDNTIKLLKSKNYDCCQIIKSKDNLGFAAANNLGLEFVSTEYVCYLNPDTILLEDIVKPSIKILKEKKEVGIVGCKLLYKNFKLQKSTFNFDNSKQIIIENLKISKLFPNFINEKFFPYDSKCKNSKYVDWIIGAQMILKTKDAKKVNGFSTDYYMYTEDMDFCMKIKKNLNKRCYYISDCSLIHIGGVSEAKNINYNRMKIILRNKLLFIKKFYSQKEMNKSYSSLLFTYRIRYIFSFLMFPFLFKKMSYYNKKMRSGIIFLKEIKKEIGVI